MTAAMSAKFNTITGSDWQRALTAARIRRAGMPARIAAVLTQKAPIICVKSKS